MLQTLILTLCMFSLSHAKWFWKEERQEEFGTFINSDHVKRTSEPIFFKIVEYRIPLPFTPEEFEIGLRYTVAKASLLETGGGEGVDVVINEPFEGKVPGTKPIVRKGIYTSKRIFLSTKLPTMFRMLYPRQSSTRGPFAITEKCWNSYPFVHNEFSNHYYSKDKFTVIIDSLYAQGVETLQNAAELNNEELAKRVVDKIDIVNDHVAPSDYKADEDPTKCVASRGNLHKGEWDKSQAQMMTAYKAYKIKLEWWRLQEKLENDIVRATRRLLLNTYRRAFCWMNEWLNMTMDELLRLEEDTRKQLDKLRPIGSARGMKEA